MNQSNMVDREEAVNLSFVDSAVVIRNGQLVPEGNGIFPSTNM